MMDYKYIEQLLERYWQGESTLEEEKILQSFFTQENIPSNMQCYKDLFIYERSSIETETLGSDFDDRMMELVDDNTTVKAIRINFTQRLRPLLKAVACVCILIAAGAVIEHSIRYNELKTESNVAEIKDTINISQPSVADACLVDTSKTLLK
ncbi:MAG: pyruvate ferredoxin oxidoreductase [Bacteroidaceae bacterium]|nr:pyruvate ferredoxin oxidoreductase [Bacteroidaceae bacterium]